MAKIRKAEPPIHLLIVDTNILWLKDKGPAVCPEFDTFWEIHKPQLRMEFLLLEVVRGELEFQHCSAGQKHIDKVTEHFIEFSAITTKAYRNRLTKDSLKKSVQGKFDRWLKGKDGKIVPIPVDTIDWKSLCASAIWRIPPFTFDPKNAENEKGFRDALVYESVVHLVQTEKRDVNIVFVCNDHLLRTTTMTRLKDRKNFLAFENLSEFSSYIKLTREQLTQEFIQRIVRRAAAKFYTNDDPNCLWTREKLWAQLSSFPGAWEIDQFEFLDTPSIAPWAMPTVVGSPPQIISTTTPFPQWLPTSGGQWYIGAHDFQNTTGDRIYHWATFVTHVRRYSLTDGTTTTKERIRVVKFRVFWNARVKSDARFYDTTLEKSELAQNDFRTPTEDDRKVFNLDLISKIPQANS